MKESFIPGAIIEVTLDHPLIGEYRHFGIVVDWDQNVINASKENDKVVCQSLEEFSGGREVVENTTIPKNGSLRWRAISNARQLLDKPYRLIFSNCEHFVRHVYGLPAESPQVENKVLGAAEFALISGSTNAEKGMAFGSVVARCTTSKDQSPFKRAVGGMIIGGVIGALFDDNE